MGKSRLQMRREVEAADTPDEGGAATTKAKPKKKAAKRKAAVRRTREKPPERKRVAWVLYSGSMKEEGRFAYDQKEAADARLTVLQNRGKKLYFMQLVKELITEGAAPITPVSSDPELDEAPVVVDPDAEEKPADGEDALGVDLEADFAEDDDDDDDDDAAEPADEEE
jgi:hypothetical protein